MHFAVYYASVLAKMSASDFGRSDPKTLRFNSFTDPYKFHTLCQCSRQIWAPKLITSSSVLRMASSNHSSKYFFKRVVLHQHGCGRQSYQAWKNDSFCWGGHWFDPSTTACFLVFVLSIAEFRPLPVPVGKQAVRSTHWNYKSKTTIKNFRWKAMGARVRQQGITEMINSAVDKQFNDFPIFLTT